MTAPVFKLHAGIQPYAWGKKGSSSLAAQLGETCVPTHTTDEDTTYAELWMGTHPNVPATLADGAEDKLVDHLRAHPSLLGDKILASFPGAKDGQLPFLFKVLSIGTALSIQAHPDKPLAERLYATRPDIYKDPNHKPEMAIALTPFLAFLNFLPLPTILLHLLSVPELAFIPPHLVSDLAASLTLPDTRPPDAFLFEPTISPPTGAQKDLLKAIFEAVMTASDQVVHKAISDLVARYRAGTDVAESERGLVDLALMLDEQYPADVGTLCCFLLNVVELKAGEAAFLGANMPHAYIKGDIVECMATSDNVVRAGLTPKLRDVDTLVSMLTYEAGPGSKQLLVPQPFSSSSAAGVLEDLYDPPIAEFSVLRIKLDAEAATTERPIDGPSIVIIIQGKAAASWGGEESLDVARGEVVFIGAGAEVKWQASEEGFEAYRAYVEAP